MDKKSKLGHDPDADLVFRASKISMSKPRFDQETEKYWQEKELIQRDIQLFETNPPAVSASKINEILLNLRDVLRRRNALHAREASVSDDMLKLEKLMEQLRNTEEGSRLRSSARANLNDAVDSISLDIKFIDRERTEIINDFQSLRTFEFGGTPLNEYHKYGISAATGKKVPEKPLSADGPGLALDTIRVAEFLNQHYDRLYESNPQLAKELENIVRYLNGGDFSRKYNPVSAEEELDKVTAKKLHKNNLKKQEQERRNQELAAREYKMALRKAGKEIMNFDREVVVAKNEAARGVAYNYDMEAFKNQSSAYQVLYGEESQRYVMRDLVNSNQMMVRTNNAMSNMITEGIARTNRSQNDLTARELEIAVLKAKIEKEKLELETARMNSERKSNTHNKQMLNAVQDYNQILSGMQKNYSSLIKDIAQV